MTGVTDWLDDPDPRRGIRLAGPGESWTLLDYATTANRAGQFARLLVDGGGRPGAVAALLVRDTETFIAAFFGCLWAGMTPAPIATPVSSRDVKQYGAHVAACVARATPSLLVCDAQMREMASAAVGVAGYGRVLEIGDPTGPPADRRDPPALAAVQFTSGSTGNPKAVGVSPDNLHANTAALVERNGITSDDTASMWLPLYHDMGLIGLLSAFIMQADLWLMTPMQFVRSPKTWLACHGRAGCSVSWAPTFGYGYAAKRVRERDIADMDFSGWRIAIAGAERVDPAVLRGFTALVGKRGFRQSAFSPCYGMAESTSAVTANPPEETLRAVRLGDGLRVGEPVPVAERAEVDEERSWETGRWIVSCGRPVGGMVVEIVDGAGRVLPEGHYGEIRIHGTSLVDGYQAADPDAAARFTPHGFRTGDAGFVLDGEVYVLGRTGDALKVRGRWLHAEDVEAALARSPQIGPGRCAVALGDETGSGQLLAVVEATGTGWIEEVLEILRASVDSALEVSVVRVRPGRVPRTSSGKPRRREVWRLARAGELGGDVVACVGPGAVESPGRVGDIAPTRPSIQV
ncbi:AMP-binding protein [Plantactinospora sp. WMMC1484]|uniref:AMP-binding protein n=1 Tax=Plantactinospora sp. WMMC1484 TaxID=3404122 RepID=UPI003BF4D74B